MMIKLLLGLSVVIAITAGLLLWGKAGWQRHVSAHFEKIGRAASAETASVDLAEVGDLPSPVKKYFYLVLKEGAPIIKRASLSQSGGFRARPDMEGWSKMEAQQHFSSRPRAFAWSATIWMFPGLSIDVCDSYIEGRGKTKGKLLSLFTLIDAQNRKELDEGALQRYLAEAVWFPTALLPSQGVSWSEIDEHNAEASVTDAGTTVSLEFEFNESGEIVSVYAPRRYREVSGAYEATPWRGRYADYIDVQGYRIPSKAEVEWQLEEQLYPYWRATIQQVEYD